MDLESENNDRREIVAGGPLVKRYGKLYFLRDDTEIRSGCDMFTGREEAYSLFSVEPYGRVKVFCCEKKFAIRQADAEVALREHGDNSIANVVLQNVVCGLNKLQDAPMSAQAHFDRAITELSRFATWKPETDEHREIVEDAIEHMTGLGVLRRYNQNPSVAG